MEQTYPSKGAVARLIPLPALAPGPFHDLVQEKMLLRSVSWDF